MEKEEKNIKKVQRLSNENIKFCLIQILLVQQWAKYVFENKLLILGNLVANKIRYSYFT